MKRKSKRRMRHLREEENGGILPCTRAAEPASELCVNVSCVAGANVLSMILDIWNEKQHKHDKHNVILR